MNSEYELCGVVHLVRPTGARACHLEQLRAAISEAPPRSLFFHARQHLLRSPALAEPPLDDLSAWVNGVVQDRETAERLQFVVHSAGTSVEELRVGLLDALARVPEAARAQRDSPEDGAFVFLTVESVPLPSGMVVHSGFELIEALVHADDSVWFYQLIEQAWFPSGTTLPEWLTSIGEERLGVWLHDLAAAGLSIEGTRQRLLRRWRRTQIGRRVGEAAAAPEDVRREAGREAVARLVRRITHTEGAR